MGNENITDILVDGIKAKALVDSGSMITSVAVEFYNALPDKPPLLQFADFNLDVSVANGERLKCLGYIEVIIVVPFCQGKSFKLPVVVVPTTSYNTTVSIIAGTNFIRLCRDTSTDDVMDRCLEYCFCKHCRHCRGYCESY